MERKRRGEGVEEVEDHDPAQLIIQVYTCIQLYYIQRKIFFRETIFLYSPCHFMRAGISLVPMQPLYRTWKKSPVNSVFNSYVHDILLLHITMISL